MVTSSNLDTTIKGVIRDALRDKLLKKFRTLPLDNQPEMVREILTPEVKKELNDIIVEHYAMFIEHDIECNLNDDDYIAIYFNRA